MSISRSLVRNIIWKNTFFLLHERLTETLGKKTLTWFIEDIKVSSIKSGFIFIELSKNTYFMIGSSHEWNMIIFIPQDENPVLIEKKHVNYIPIHFFNPMNRKNSLLILCISLI
jgi:hypothetical protein